jgi:hypothetical protein
MSAPKLFPSGIRDALKSWFDQYGSNTRHEIEFRVQNVGQAGFERLLASLQSNKGWSSVCTVVSLDMVHATGVRETKVHDKGHFGPSCFLRKNKRAEITFDTPVDYTVRFQVSDEIETSADSSESHTFRHKQRYTFTHKDLFKFELTRVKQGPSDQAALAAETQFEVELEFCGQLRMETSRSEYLTDSMLMKAADMVQQLSYATSGGGPLASQQRRAGTAPQECDEVVIAAGVEVLLDPPGHGAPPSFGGEMPAELVERVRWLYSHRQPDGRAYVMSEPSHLLNQSYPLYFFCGTVPYESISVAN